jgi:hypothetical protein
MATISLLAGSVSAHQTIRAMDVPLENRAMDVPLEKFALRQPMTNPTLGFFAAT